MALSQLGHSRGDRDATAFLSFLHCTGRGGVEQDHAEAVRLITPGAAAGHCACLRVRGLLLCYGRGLPQDKPAAVEAWKQAYAMAPAFYSDIAAFDLGHSHRLGYGVQEDIAEARRYYAASLQLGYDGAQDELNALPAE